MERTLTLPSDPGMMHKRLLLQFPDGRLGALQQGEGGGEMRWGGMWSEKRGSILVPDKGSAKVSFAPPPLPPFSEPLQKQAAGEKNSPFLP